MESTKKHPTKSDSGWWLVHQPLWKNMSQNGNLPQVGVKIKYLKPLPSDGMEFFTDASPLFEIDSLVIDICVGAFQGSMIFFEGRDGEWVEHHDLHDMLLFFFKALLPGKLAWNTKKMEVWFRWFSFSKGWVLGSSRWSSGVYTWNDNSNDKPFVLGVTWCTAPGKIEPSVPGRHSSHGLCPVAAQERHVPTGDGSLAIGAQ